MASLFKAECSRLLLIGAYGTYSRSPASRHTRQVLVSFSRCYRKNLASVVLPRTDIRANEKIASSLYTRNLTKPRVSLYLNNQLCNRFYTSTTNTMDSTAKMSSKNGHSSPLEETSPAFTEVQIPTPWGHLAAKIWGKPNDHPILALHGWQDNAGTFDQLIPLLPPDFYVVCLDFCGHGLSSHYPPGMLYNFWDHIIHLRIVAAHFNWSRFSILGHSMGGIVGSMFAAVSPNMIEKLAMIDIVKPISIPAKAQPEKSIKAIESCMQVLKKMERPPPSYSYEAARERLVAANNGSLDAISAEILMRRGTKKVSNGEYIFSRDLRHVITSMASYTAEQHAEYAKRVHCPLLLIKANQGFIYEDKAVIEDFVQIYRGASLGGFQHIRVDGTHHVHLVTPENVAAPIASFFSIAANDKPHSTID